MLNQMSVQDIAYVPRGVQQHNDQFDLDQSRGLQSDANLSMALASGEPPSEEFYINQNNNGNFKADDSFSMDNTAKKPQKAANLSWMQWFCLLEEH